MACFFSDFVVVVVDVFFLLGGEGGLNFLLVGEIKLGRCPFIVQVELKVYSNDLTE